MKMKGIRKRIGTTVFALTMVASMTGNELTAVWAQDGESDIVVEDEVLLEENDAAKEKEETKAEEEKSRGNDTDITIKLLSALPGFVIKFVVWLLRNLDAIGLMPKIVNKVSPFHSSAFVTNVGSIGLNPVYHHLYEFGTTSVFMAIGKKEMVNEIDRDGNVNSRHVINIRFVLDERICDGYYYASAFKMVKRLVENPELLEKRPEQVYEDID